MKDIYTVKNSWGWLATYDTYEQAKESAEETHKFLYQIGLRKDYLVAIYKNGKIYELLPYPPEVLQKHFFLKQYVKFLLWVARKTN